MRSLACHSIRRAVLSVFLALGLFLCGCQSAFLLHPHANAPLPGDSNLMTGNLMTEDSVILEVFLVRCPHGDPDLNTELWKDVDEQAFPAPLRREMLANGIRAGLIGNQLPPTFLRILKARDDEDPSQIVTTVRLGELSDTQHLLRRTICSRNGQRNEVNVSDVKQQATIFFRENEALGGETFHQAQGVLAIRTQTCGDGSVKLEIFPEVQYGQQRQTFEYDAGAYKMVSARPRRSFDTLNSELRVRPGQFIVMTGLPNIGGNVGSFFFTNEEGANGAEQKMFCVRVLQTQHNEMFTENGGLPMDPNILPEEVAGSEDEDEAEE